MTPSRRAEIEALEDAPLLDKRGIPIMRGDLVKVFHFTGARRKRHYMYKHCLGVRSFKEGGARYMFFSHLNFVDDLRAKKDAPYLERLGRQLHDYEIVQSIACDHENRARSTLSEIEDR